MKKHEIIDGLIRLGVEHSDAFSIRRIAMTLGNWFEKECGIDDGHIERDEITGLPYWFPADRYINGKCYSHRPYKIADREKGAMRRLDNIRARYENLIFYVQTDPRGASIYVLRRCDVENLDDVERMYSRGFAVWKGN